MYEEIDNSKFICLKDGSKILVEQDHQAINESE